MRTIEEFINSGILELYVLGNTSAAENAQIEVIASLHPEVKEEIEAISDALAQYASMHAIEPDATVKPFLMAVIDYMERLHGGEQPVQSPLLSPGIRTADFAEWLQREDMILPEDFEGIFAKIISYAPEMTTAIVWIKDMAPHEVHHDEHEKFLVVEGSCDIIVEGKVHSLTPGDYFSIPLHQNHLVKVTSNIPCKVILQRMAA